MHEGFPRDPRALGAGVLEALELLGGHFAAVDFGEFRRFVPRHRRGDMGAQGHGEEIEDVSVDRADAEGCDEDETPNQACVERGELGREVAPRREPDDVDRSPPALSQPTRVDTREVAKIHHPVDARRVAKARL